MKFPANELNHSINHIIGKFIHMLKIMVSEW